ncbi:MAG: hypothetical protein OEZ48_06080 [Candidatus Bathyarchaeota archaeon]|nr:hypothetical protein [Candidatus Bathyarchaeota archaeon]
MLSIRRATPDDLAALTEIYNEAGAHSAGTKMPRTNMKWFRQMPVLSPTIQEQRHIAVYVDSLQEKVEALTELQEETAKEIEEPTPSILDRAFERKLQRKQLHFKYT